MSNLLKRRTIKVIKLVAAFLTVISLHAVGETTSQTVSLSLQNEPIQKFFEEIRKQTGFSFVYKEELLTKSKPVTVNVKNETLEKTLEMGFSGQPFGYAIVDKYIILQPRQKVLSLLTDNPIDNDQINVRGRVVNDKGDPMAGVTVSVKGKQISTVTDADGEFFLETIEKDAVLVFTHVGMEEFELRVSGRTELEVKLKTKISELDDVIITVSTGYQEIPKERATGSFVKVDNKTLNQQTGVNILQRLDGVVPGLLFNIGKGSSGNGAASRTNITIRGFSTIEASLDPLIVLDRFIYKGDINNINPNDIESVTVLKDAAATSIYGAQGGNGVIVITTKKGKLNQKTKIDINSDVIINEKRDFFSIPQMSVSDYVDVEKYLFDKGFFNPAINNFRRALTPAQEIMYLKKKGLITAEDSAREINILKGQDVRKDYDKYFNPDVITQQYSLNIYGGSSNLAWLVSGAYDKSSLINGLGNEKINLRVNNSYRPVNGLQLNFSVYYTANKTSGNPMPNYLPNSNANTINVAQRQVPYLKLADDQGNPLPVSLLYNNRYIDTLAGGAFDWKYYPIQDYKYLNTKVNRRDLTAYFDLNYQIMHDLAVGVSYQYQHQNSTSKNVYDAKSYYARDLINKFSQVTRGVGGSVTSITHDVLPLGNILQLASSELTAQNLRAQINYNKTMGDHDINAIAGFEVQETVIDNGVNSTTYGYSEDPVQYAIVDFKDRYQTVLGSQQSIPGYPTVQGTSTARFVSYFTNASYTYKQRYTASVSVRRDGSNIFGATTNDKWKPFWSAGLMWDVSREKFYKFDYLPTLKLKATIGYSGNIDLAKTPLPIENFLGVYESGFTYAQIIRMNNPSLRWEKAKQISIGLDFGLKNQRITGSVEYYIKEGIDLYGPAFFDYTSGISNTITMNVAGMRGHGVDLSARVKIVESKLRWSNTFIFNYNASKVTKYYDPSADKVSTIVGLGAGNVIIPVIGKPLYAIAAYKWGGLNSSGDPQGFVDGQLSTDYTAIFNEGRDKGENGNIIYVGPAIPPIFGSYINEIGWKGFAASFNIVYKFGYYFRKPTLSYGALYRNGIGHADFGKRWMKPGDESITNVPAMVYTNYPNFDNRDGFYSQADINVLKADNIRLQYVNLSYSIGKTSKKIPFDQVQVYLNAANLGIIWRANDEGYDPDYPRTFTPTKAYTIGVRATF